MDWIDHWSMVLRQQRLSTQTIPQIVAPKACTPIPPIVSGVANFREPVLSPDLKKLRMPMFHSLEGMKVWILGSVCVAAMLLRGHGHVK